jgi:cytochrome P450
MDRVVTDRGEIERILGDPDYTVATAPAGETGLEWLRAHVCRFANGAPHARRRALVESELARLQPSALRADACRRAQNAADADGVARTAPLGALAAALGIAPDEIDGTIADATLVGRCYLGGEQQPGVDDAVNRLVQRLGRDGEEPSAAAVAVLAQACDATANLITSARSLAGDEPGLAADSDRLLAETLVRRPPLPALRRVAPDGATVVLEGPPQFGAGIRPCPGRDEALALAAGVLDALR